MAVRRFSDAAFDVGDRDKNRAFQHAVFSSVHVFRRQGGGVGRAFYVATFSVAEAHFCGTSSPNQQENNTMRE